MLDVGAWANGRPLAELELENELALTMPGCWPFWTATSAGSWGAGADSVRLNAAPTLETWDPVLNGGGREPVGRAGLSLRRLARYEAEAECECLLFHGGLRGGMAVARGCVPFCESVKFVGAGGETFLPEPLKLALLLCNI